MLAKSYMIESEKVFQIQPHQTLEEALQLMSRSYKALPVVEDNKFVGVLEKVAVYDAFYEDQDCAFKEFMKQHKVSEFMRSDITTIEQDERFSAVLLCMEKLDIDFLPIHEEGNFAGIITRNRVFKAFEEGFGLDKDGYVLELFTLDTKGKLLEIAQLLKKHNANTLNILIFDLDLMKNDRIILKIETDKIEEIKEDFTTNGFRVGECYYEEAKPIQE